MRKNTIRLNESQLRQIVKESVRNVVNEMSLHNKKTGEYHKWNMGGWAPTSTNTDEDEYAWKYNGDECDKYMWYLKKLAEKDGQTRNDGWPTSEFINNKYFRFFEEKYDTDLGSLSPLVDDYTLEDLYRLCDHLCYLRQMAYETYGIR